MQMRKLENIIVLLCLTMLSCHQGKVANEGPEGDTVEMRRRG